ncbi:MAG: GNAT family N-acetyltransferase [Bryobacteraceae bacterium]
MTPEIDPDTGLPVGPRVDPGPARLPGPATMEGRYVRLEPLHRDRHGEALYAALRGADSIWRYLPDGPFAVQSAFDEHLAKITPFEHDPYFFSIVDRECGLARGYAALMRVDAAHRSIEVGYIVYTPALQKTRGATEAMYLLARHVFEELGYRRYEWKCDSLNAASRRAALRLGFIFEGIFRQHRIVKGRSRDTAWFSMIDSEWPELRAGFERWLDPENFDGNGTQQTRLHEDRRGQATSPAGDGRRNP